jgi:cell division protein FtsB
MPKNSAEYMRAYRARKAAEHTSYDAEKPLIGQLKSRVGELEAEVARLTDHLDAVTGDHAYLTQEVIRLEEEVARLKRELAARPTTDILTRSERAFVDSASLDRAYQMPRHLVTRDPIRDPMREFHPAPKPGQKKGK